MIYSSSLTQYNLIHFKYDITLHGCCWDFYLPYIYYLFYHLSLLYNKYVRFWKAVKSLNEEMEIQARFNQVWIISTAENSDTFPWRWIISSHHKTISIVHSLSLFYIVVYGSDVGLQFTLMIDNPTGSSLLILIS